MSNTNYHGLTTQGKLNILTSFHSMNPKQSSGRFGRMLDLYPLYLSTITLENLGRKGGVMEASANCSNFTNNIPLGMIFLGQFIDHDITLDATSSFNKINEPTETENFRTPNLDLDCIFGDGPEVSPYLYERNTLRLITGASNHNHGQDPILAASDLARTSEGVAIIGDPRNDENRIISQLQLAFICFYNAIYDHIAVERAAEKLTNQEIYEEARRLTSWHYQWVVLHEFLPLICGKETVDRVLGLGRQFYRPKYDAFIPVEFSVAAYRFGHSMIAQKLQVQRGSHAPVFDLFSPEIGRGFQPVTSADQVVDWHVFFDFDGDFQRAEKLDIKLAADLLDLPFIRGSANDKSLAIRNLKRGQSFLLPSGENVARKLGRSDREIRNVRQFLESAVAGENIDLGPGIPLWLYILAEAQVVGRDANTGMTGEGLGPVGGTIVAEVLIGLMELDTRSFLGSDRNWTPTLGILQNKFCMTDLLKKAASHLKPVTTKEEWKKVNIHTNADIYCAHYPGDSEIGYCCGNKGVILKTVDRGNTWHACNSGISPKDCLLSVHFLDSQAGWVVGKGGCVYQTYDGGKTWLPAKLPHHTCGDLRCVFFINREIGFVVSDEGYYRTVNAGKRWKKLEDMHEVLSVENPAEQSGKKIYFLDQKTGFIQLKGKLLKTKDGGHSWAPVDIPDASCLFDICVVKLDKGHLYGIGKQLYQSTDWGESWVKVDYVKQTSSSSSEKETESDLVAEGKAKVYHSENGEGS